MIRFTSEPSPASAVRTLVYGGLLAFLLIVACLRPGEADEGAPTLERLTTDLRTATRNRRYDEAIAAGVKALALAESTHGPDARKTASVLLDLARPFYWKGAAPTAEGHLRRALAIFEKTDGPESVLVGRALNNLAYVLTDLNKFDEAEHIYRRTVELYQVLGDPEARQLGTAHRNLGRLYRKRNQIENAEESFKTALAIFERDPKANDQLIDPVVIDLADLYQAKRRFGEAEERYHQSLALRKARYGAEHSKTIEALDKLAMVLKAQSRFAETVPIYNEILAIYQARSDGSPPPDFLWSLAQGLASSDDPERAEQPARRALELVRAVSDEKSAEVAEAYAKFAVLTFTVESYEAAKQSFQKSLDLFDSLAPEGHVRAAQSTAFLAKIAEREGDAERAERHYVEALERYERLGGPTNRNWRTVAIELMALLSRQDRMDELAPILIRYAGAIGTERDADRLLDQLQGMINGSFKEERFDTTEWLLERAIAIADTHTGAAHPKRASLQLDLGALFETRGRHADAATQFSRAVELYEREANGDTAHLANAQSRLARSWLTQQRLNDAGEMATSAIKNGRRSETYPPADLADNILMLAYIRKSLGDIAAADALFEDAAQFAKAQLGEDSVAFAVAQAMWASSLLDRGDMDRAEELFKRSLTLQDLAGRGETTESATMNEGLAFLLYKTRRYVEALPLQQRALAVRMQRSDPDDPAVADNLVLLGDIQAELGRADESLATYRRALTIREGRYDPGDDRVIEALRRVAAASIGQGFGQASRIRREILERLEHANRSASPLYAQALRDLAGLQLLWNRLADAEDLAKRALALDEMTDGANGLGIVESLETLVSVYLGQRRYLDAADLQLRLLAVLDQQPVATPRNKAQALQQLARIKYGLGREAEAIDLIEQAFALQAPAESDDAFVRAGAFKELGSDYVKFGRFDEAERAYEQALKLHQAALGSNHPTVALDLLALSAIQAQRRDAVGALNAYKRAIEFLSAHYGQDHPIVAALSLQLPYAYLAAGRIDEAERHLASQRESASGAVESLPGAAEYYQAIIDATKGLLEKAIVGVRKRVATKQRLMFGHSQSGRIGAATLRTAGRLDQLFLVSLLDQAAKQQPHRRKDLLGEAFEVTQLGDVGATAGAVSQMAVRFGSDSNDLGDLVRGRQDAAERWQYFNGQLLREAGKPVSERNPAKEAATRQKATAFSDLLDSLDNELKKRFPAYAELIKPQPASLGETQHLLHSNEALLYYRVFDTSNPLMLAQPVADLTRGKAALWVVRADRSEVYWMEASDDDSEKIARSISRLRAGLDLTGRGAIHPGASSPRRRPFDLDTAHALYRELLAPAADVLDGADHLIFVLDGPLQSLPLAVLVTEAPPAIETDADYRSVRWLAREHAITVLPSVSSLAALRRQTTASSGKRAFVGIGDPLLVGHPEAAPRPIQVASAGRRGLVADVESVRAMSSLPETADELGRMAATLGADPDRDLILREAATETEIKNRDLSPYRVVAFATHGLMAGELMKALEEPGLVLTPPQKGTDTDDGLLTASEIAQLRLNADWVILSACNTAAAGTANGAEGLSGLARAFFYAGARALLVSHWAVDSEATVLLTTGMFDVLRREPTVGRAEALRRSMLALMDNPDRPAYAHPSFWAPFVVVGEGGESGS